DPFTALGILVGLVMAFRSGEGSLIAVGVGVVLYLAYVAKVGGDFMLGRFLSLPFLAAVLVLVRRPLDWSPFAGGFRIAFLFLIGLVMPLSPLRSGIDHGQGLGYTVHGVGDSRVCYYPSAGLLPVLFRHGGQIDHFWHERGVRVRQSGVPVT